ncbi:MAG TPA: hypothetical protein PKN13_00475 [Accumulibacter sp.]|nr:hypothetical protein [Accumulibacter sp.]HMW16235.1 hypothetical protein [Accumulibacter sp.]HMX21414.1 hypothetical protein [Accumulibacter sp.]HMY05908.1 hypothetical protein [Accumulibacter sp.]HNC16746.1 hypothetical protein [Accumulibacter sp.]
MSTTIPLGAAAILVLLAVVVHLPKIGSLRKYLSIKKPPLSASSSSTYFWP